MLSLAKGQMAPNGDAQDHARSVGVISVQSGVIRKKREFLIDAAAGKGLRNDQLALDIAFDA